MALYLVATPIGNLEDMTYRAVRILQEVDVILAEDTRRTRILLSHFHIEGKRVEAYHQYNEHTRTNKVINEILEGKNMALVTDAGMPCISDPGFFLVRESVAAGIEPIIIPGVSAVTFAVAIAGFPCDQFLFLGFPHVKKGRREQLLSTLKNEKRSAFLYESPYRIKKLLEEIELFLGKEREVAIIREATKVHEEILRGPIGELNIKWKDRNWKGEFVVAICGIDRKSADSSES